MSNQTRQRIRAALALSLCIGGPFTAGINAGVLWGDIGYEAQPWKVFLGLMFGLFGAATLWDIGK